METRKDRMNHEYIPRVNDYVKWYHSNFVHEGWVYFVGDEYITIEIGVKCKNDENISDCPIHQKYHTLLVCHHWNWHQLEYVKCRESVNS